MQDFCGPFAFVWDVDYAQFPEKSHLHKVTIAPIIQSYWFTMSFETPKRMILMLWQHSLVEQTS